MTMYIFDSNFIIDVLADRRGYKQKYFDIVIYCLERSLACMSANQIDTLRYIIKKDFPNVYDLYLNLEKRVNIVKTPSYIDFEHELAMVDIEDYMIELSAESIDARIITSDKRFLAVSKRAIQPDAFYQLEMHKEGSIDFANLKKQYFMYQPELEKEMDKVLKSAAYIMGDAARELEENLCAFTGAKNAITCSSGTDALLLAMMALDIKPGDEVITTPFTFIATAETIALLGAKPVFVDIDEKTYNIDPTKIEAAITEKTKAIMPVSLYGQPADLDAIQEIVDKTLKTKNQKLYTIIDGAQSFGATYKGKAEVHYADIYTTSFFPAKPLGCFGDGGAVLTNDDTLAEKMKMLRIHGQNRRYHHKYIGLGGRMDTLQCAVVNVKLKHYAKDLALRQEVAQKYTQALKTKNQKLKTPIIKDDRTSAWAQYSIRVKDRDEVQARLKERGIPTAVHYPMPLHQQECFAYLGYEEGDFPVAERVSQEIMSLPMNPYLSRDEIAYIVENL